MHKLNEEQQKALTALGNWAAKFLDITERAADTGTPDTMLHEVRKATEAHVATISADGAKQFFETLMELLTQPEFRRDYVASFSRHAAELEARATKTGEGADLFDRLVALERGAVGASLIVVGDAYDASSMGREMMRPSRYLRAITDAPNGEAIAMHLIDTIRLVAEPAYARYLRVLLRLDAAARGELRGAFDAKFGQLVNSAAPLFPSLVEKDIAHIRNSGAHGSWGYDVPNDAVVITDLKWTRRIELTALGDITFRAFNVSGTVLNDVLSAYSTRALAKSGAWEGLASALARVREPGAEERFEEAQARLWQPIRARWHLS